MVTHVWLKEQPKKKISYPNCYPVTGVKFEPPTRREIYIKNMDDSTLEAWFNIELISRVEFRP